MNVERSRIPILPETEPASGVPDIDRVRSLDGRVPPSVARKAADAFRRSLEGRSFTPTERLLGEARDDR